MAQKRLYFPKLGEYYDDCLKVESVLKNNTVAGEAASLLRAKLMERETQRSRIIAYLARRRNISDAEMWDLILSGQHDINTKELQELQNEPGT